MPSKICSRCKIEKDTSCFGKHSRSRDNLQTQCKSCISEYKNTDKYKEAQKDYQEKSPVYKTSQSNYRKTERGKNAHKVYHNSNKGRYMKSKAGAKYRGIDFLFTLEEYTAMISENKLCYYCGRAENESTELCRSVFDYGGNDPKILKLKSNMSGKGHSSDHLTVDRMDSFGPYSMENCVMCCSLCNHMKGWGISHEGWKSIAVSEVDKFYSLMGGTNAV